MSHDQMHKFTYDKNNMDKSIKFPRNKYSLLSMLLASSAYMVGTSCQSICDQISWSDVCVFHLTRLADASSNTQWKCTKITQSIYNK
jgi:hypothetical protein